jgi:hypothetical protein
MEIELSLLCLSEECLFRILFNLEPLEILNLRLVNKEFSKVLTGTSFANRYQKYLKFFNLLYK